MTLYRRGHIRTTVDGAEFFVSPGSVLVVPPAGAHGEYALTGYANSYLMLKAPERWPWPLHIPPAESSRIADIFDAIADEKALQSTPMGSELIDVLVRELDLRLRRFVTSSASGPRRTVDRPSGSSPHAVSNRCDWRPSRPSSGSRWPPCGHTLIRNSAPRPVHDCSPFGWIKS